MGTMRVGTVGSVGTVRCLWLEYSELWVWHGNGMGRYGADGAGECLCVLLWVENATIGYGTGAVSMG